MGGFCSNCSGLNAAQDPDIDEQKFKRHREKLLPSSEFDHDTNPIHLTVIEKDINKLKKQLKQQKDKINELDHHGYTPLHLAVLLKWNKGIDALLSYYASPITQSAAGWTAIDEAITTKQVKVFQKLAKSLRNNMSEYSKQNVLRIYKQLIHSTDFYIEMKLESFAKGLSNITGQYFPSDTLKIWKKEGMVRVDMTLLDYDYDNREWIRGNVSNIFMVKQSGSFDFYYIDHDKKSVDLQPNKPLLNNDNITFTNKALFKPVKSRKIEIKQAQFKRSKSWIGGAEEEVINDIQCEVYKATDIQFVTKYRNQHIAREKRKHIKNDSSIVALIIAGDSDDEEDDDDMKGYDVNDIKCDYIPAQIPLDNYSEIQNGDNEIREKAKRDGIRFDVDESFVINTIQTEESRTSYEISIYMTDKYGMNINEVLVVFDLLGVQTSHMNNVKRILQLTAYDDSRFPLCLEMPLLLNVVRAKVTFESLDRTAIDRKVFDIPKQYKR